MVELMPHSWVQFPALQKKKEEIIMKITHAALSNHDMTKESLGLGLHSTDPTAAHLHSGPSLFIQIYSELCLYVYRKLLDLHIYFEESIPLTPRNYLSSIERWKLPTDSASSRKKISQN